MNPRLIEKGVKVWSQKVDKVCHERMPDDALAAILEKAKSSPWWTAFILLAYNAAARRDDVLRLKWCDLDLDGSDAERFGMPQSCPSVRITNNKGREPRRVPLHPRTVKALQELKDHPVALTAPRCPRRAGLIDEHVFPVLGYSHPASQVSVLFGELVASAGLVDAAGMNRYSLHDLRRKMNDDTARAGGSLRDQMAICGHRSAAVNVRHYQTESAERLRELLSHNSVLGRTA